MSQYQKWEEANKDAMSTIRSMVTQQENLSEEAADFRKLAEWIFETDENPWGFLPQGWEDSKGSAQGFQAFLWCLHHAMMDDGDVCFVDDPMHGPCMEFSFYCDEEEGEGVYLDHHHKDYEENDLRMNAMLERCGKEGHYSSIADIEYHTDVQRFIDGFEKHRIKSEERDSRFEERRKEKRL